MAKFVIECPNCGKYAQASSGLFGFIGKTKKVGCACGHTIDVNAEKFASRECPHCGNNVVFDQSKGSKAVCPVCGEPINTMAEQNKFVEFSCAQCGVRLQTAKTAATYKCPVCDHLNNVAERSKTEQIRMDGLASVIKYEGDADTLVWKHPIEDFNMGSQLIVHESQEAIFFRDGQALDLFGAGRYTLETQQLPILEKLYKLPTDTESTFHSEVYFFNLIHQMGIKWGTAEKITFIEPTTGAPISLGVRGLMNFRVADSRKLLLKLVGTGSGLTRQELAEDGESHIKDYFRGVIQLAVSTNLANVITSDKVDIVQLDQQKIRLSAAMLETLQPYFEDYGIVITEFLIMGILLPQKGDLGYESWQTILKIRQSGLTKSAIATETELKLAELEAQKQLDIRIQQNMAEVEAAHRNVVAQKGETSVLEAQYEGQKKVAEATGEVAAERLRMQLEMEHKAQLASIEAEEMRLKGYTQKDVMQTEVQKAFAQGIGTMGSAGSAGGSSILGDMVGLGVGMAAAGTVVPQIGNMMNVFQKTAESVAPTGWECPECGAKNITSKFCPECGSKKPEPKTGWTCPQCGTQNITSKFCPECGARKPEEPKGWVCPECGTKDIKTKFCPECGAKKPEEGWTCPECGHKKGE